MNINEFKQLIELWANKAQTGASFSPSEFNLSAKQGYIEWVMSKYGNDKEYQTGKEIPRVSWQKTQKITDDLSYLLKKVELTVDSNGKFDLPTDYLHLSSIRTKLTTVSSGVADTKEKFVDVLRDNELSHRFNSQLVQPTLKYPVCSFYNGYVQMYPKNVQRVVFTYLRKPVPPVWGFTLDSNGRAIYAALSSTDLEAPDEVINDIAIRVLRYIAINIRDNQLQQYAEQMKQTGI